jgi:regulator of cell morphogenesis and NO signaling
MIEIDDAMTVRDAVVKYPETKKALERLGIDYCCGGNNNLLEAAAEKGLDAVALGKALTESTSKAASNAVKDWSKASATELAHHILDTHHVFMKRELPRLEDLSEKVLKAHGESHGKMLESLRRTFLGLKEEIEMHLVKEEEILFPLITDLDSSAQLGGPPPVSHCGSVQNPIHQMKYEHDAAGAALAEMRRITEGYGLPEDACPSFVALYEGLQALERDLHEHIHLENNILFPMSIELERTLLS